MIHSSAVVDPGAELRPDVHVGPFSVIGPGVVLGSGTRVGSHVVIEGPTRIGERNRIHSFSVLGGAPQDKKYRGEESTLEIGNDNVIREYCTFNRGTEGGGMATRVGDGNWIMAYVHIAHDCRVGDDNVMANATTLAGHVEVEDCVTLGAFTVVHQFCRIGRHAFSAMGAVILKDVPPFVTVAGNSASPRGLNTVGLRRRGFPAPAMQALKSAYKVVYKRGLTLDSAVEQLAGAAKESAEVSRFLDFVRSSGRGIVR